MNSAAKGQRRAVNRKKKKKEKRLTLTSGLLRSERSGAKCTHPA
jgi:hypothetical protein